MRGVLFVLTLIASVECKRTLNDIVDVKLKQLAKTLEVSTGSLSGAVGGELRGHHFKLALSGLRKNVTRTSDVTLTRDDDGQVFQWTQQEPLLAYTGHVFIEFGLGTHIYDVTGNITLNPVKVELRQKYGRFRVTVTKLEAAGVKNWTLTGGGARGLSNNYFHINITPGLNQALASQLHNSPFWASVYEGPAWALEWPELSEYLERAQI
ncbi:hypothetical protein HDE_13303 [Halotydeus destructor]|nr:hypothetical protein HDE_13303 [Halotydeus destructor]